MNSERIIRYTLIAAAVALTTGLGVTYFYVTHQPVGDACPLLTTVPEGVEFAERRRSEQRLDYNYDMRPTKDGQDSLSCLKIFDEAKCSITGPALVAGQLGHSSEPEFFDIPDGRVAVVRLNLSRMLCVMPDA